jgi:hypothetical protein
MSYKPEMFVQGEWCSNQLRFATEEEAKSSAKALFMRWTLPEKWRVSESDDPVNYKWENGREVAL